MVRGTIDVVAHADGIQRFFDDRIEFGVAQAEVVRTEGNVFADRRHEELVVGILEDDADFATHSSERFLVRRVDAFTGNLDETVLGGVDAVHVHDERGLPRAIRAEQRDAFTLFDHEIHAVQRLVPVRISESELVDAQTWCHRNRPRVRTAAIAGSASATAH